RCEQRYITSGPSIEGGGQEPSEAACRGWQERCPERHQAWRRAGDTGDLPPLRRPPQARGTLLWPLAGRRKQQECLRAVVSKRRPAECRSAGSRPCIVAAPLPAARTWAAAHNNGGRSAVAGLDAAVAGSALARQVTSR